MVYNFLWSKRKEEKRMITIKRISVKKKNIQIIQKYINLTKKNPESSNRPFRVAMAGKAPKAGSGNSSSTLLMWPQLWRPCLPKIRRSGPALNVFSLPKNMLHHQSMYCWQQGRHREFYSGKTKSTSRSFFLLFVEFISFS